MKAENGQRRRTRTTDFGQVVLLAALSLSAFGWPVFQENEHLEDVFEALTAIVIASALLVVMNNRSLLVVLLGVGIAAVAADLVSSDASPALEIAANVGNLLFSLILAGALLSQIFSRSRDIDWRIIANAVTVYLLIGLAFASAYELMGIAGSLTDDLPDFLDQGPDGQELAATYFSFVTLTTLGYGDLTPATSSVASLAMFEAALGQLYLAIIVARLVGLHIARADRQ